MSVRGASGTTVSVLGVAPSTGHGTTATDPLARTDTGPGVPIELANASVERLFSVGLALASCLSIMDGPAAAGALEAVDGLGRRDS